MAELQMNDIKKIYGKDVVAVQDFNLHIKDKEFIVFVGPSGCGKSTTLRMIAGLEEISEGELHIDENLMNDVAPKDRDIAMVFQNYALYPHMNVYDNMAFGLKLRKFKKPEIKERVDNAAKILGLEELLDRKPKALSGGQRQRVALGRAIVRNPKVFLMDEPLSNLDAKLRVQMRAEIQKLHNRLQTTTIYVTHDQTEAMTMATRLVVMESGIIQQVGTPKEIYDNPENVFVGGFIGSPAMNFLVGEVKDDQLHIGDVTVTIPEDRQNILKEKGYNNKKIILGIRPEDIYDANDTDWSNGHNIPITVDVAELMGSETIVYGKVNNQDIVARIEARTGIETGSKMELQFDMANCHFFDPESEERIKGIKVETVAQ
ncbi:MAG TPA: sn-glycerol-3-phosphate ABC transporter ATP-binding protein UgpC [Pseudogracilibacillus sp.]|nr:sn-glycerol-3-phosphate ABC transporter ATP-binding protein UgpC [Pseudogracilibacillus sp.]